VPPLERQTAGEIVIRIVHIAIGLILIGVAAWFGLITSPQNLYVFWGFLAIGALPLSVAFFGSRKTVFQLLLLGWL
jgi:hypothetical protein